MKTHKKAALVAAAITGLVAGSANYLRADDAKPADAKSKPAKAKTAKHACAGKNSCKGKGGCATDGSKK